MNSNQQMLIKQIVNEVQALPENLIQEVLDFIGYLRTKHEADGEADRKEERSWGMVAPSVITTSESAVFLSANCSFPLAADRASFSPSSGVTSNV